MDMTQLIFDLNTIVPKTDGAGKKIPVGIHENVRLKTLTLEAGKSGNQFIKLTFEDAQGRTIDKALWQPKGTYPRDGETPVDAFTREAIENLGIVRIIVETLNPLALTMLRGDYDSIRNMLPGVIAGKETAGSFNIKVIPDESGKYSELSNYGFVEKHVIGQPATLAFSTWELTNRINRKPVEAYTEKNVNLTDLF